MIFSVIPGNPSQMEFCTKKSCLWQAEGACREMSASHDIVSLCEMNADGREQMRLYASTIEHVQQ